MRVLRMIVLTVAAAAIGYGAPGMTTAHAAPETAKTSSKSSQSGLKLPRFVSLRTEEVNVRAGPGVRYPVKWVFVRRNLPVEITAEF